MIRNDYTEEGFGCYFHDTWLIVDVPVADAKAVLDRERELVRLVDRLAQDEAEFEAIATAIEHGDREDLPERLLSEPFTSEIDPHIDEEMPPLEGLELGVAGLTLALAAAGCYPAASCRSHHVRSWSDTPVVLFASDQGRAEAIASIAVQTGCSLGIDPARPQLLSVYAPTIEGLMLLGRSILDPGLSASGSLLH